MVDKYYQKTKKSCERYQNVSEEEEKKTKKDLRQI